MMPTLEAIDGNNWEAFVNAPIAVLVLGKSDCAACNEWSEELSAFLNEDQNLSEFNEVRFGKITLDKPGLASFKRANTWLADVDVLPFNVIYKNGEQVKKYAGGGVERLTHRLQRLSEA